jgi:hypothetical protein
MDLQSAHDASSERLLFEYQPLERASMIRLIEVRSNRINGFIYVALKHVHFPALPKSLPQPLDRKDKPRFKCLSYTWGEPTEDYKILVNGKLLHVRKNLFEFLELATELYSNEPLWIDALCINQGDHREKSQQVQKMGTIYEHAELVLVWFGESVLEKLKLSQNGLSTFPEWKSLNWWQEPELSIGMGQLSKQYGTEYILQAICEHPYWARAWIAQEILLPGTARILVGREWILWAGFGQHLRHVSIACPWVDPTRLATSMYATWSDTRSAGYWSGVDRLGFWKLFKTRSSSECVEIRDRIYSLLAIAFEVVGNQPLIVDYGERIEGLFWRVVEAYDAWKKVNHIGILMRALNLSTDALDEWLIENPGIEIAVLGSTAKQWILRPNLEMDMYENKLKDVFRKKGFTVEVEDLKFPQEARIKATDLLDCFRSRDT